MSQIGIDPCSFFSNLLQRLITSLLICKMNFPNINRDYHKFAISRVSKITHVVLKNNHFVHIFTYTLEIAN